jgi:hypothetical protein
VHFSAISEHPVFRYLARCVCQISTISRARCLAKRLEGRISTFATEESRHVPRLSVIVVAELRNRLKDLLGQISVRKDVLPIVLVSEAGMVIVRSPSLM